LSRRRVGFMGSADRVTSAAEGLPRRRFTVAEVEAMVAAGVMEEDERVELIGGSWFRCLRREAIMRWSRARSSIAGSWSGLMLAG
jgi:hypothetical protein